jgi:hypothetical protein
MIAIQPSTQFEASLTGAPTGLTGTIGVRVVDNVGATAVARATTNIVETPAGSGFYVARITSPASVGQYSVVWDTGGSLTPTNTAEEDLWVTTAPQRFTVNPSTTFETTFAGPTGLVGVIGVRLVDGVGGTAIARTASGIIEFPAGSGFYQATLTAPATAGQYQAVWDTGMVSPTTVAGDDVVVIATSVSTPSTDSGERIPPYLAICGREISNPARVLTYILSYARPGRFYNIDLSALPSILYRLTGAPQTFTSPAADPAPWYDGSQSSIDFLGVLIDQIQGFGGVTDRSVTRLGTGGASIGSARRTERVLGVRGTIVATSYAGQEYGRQWLKDVFAQSCDPCGICDVDVRLIAAPDNGSNDSLGAWTMKQGGVTKGPIFEDLECPDILGFTAEVTVGRPELYKDAINCLPTTTLWPGNGGGACVSFDQWLCGTGGPQNCCTITPPIVGEIAVIVTLDGSAGGAQNVRLSTYSSCPPDVSADGDTTLLIPDLPVGSTLVIDSAAETMTYTSPDGEVSDGTPFVEFTEDDWPWIVLDDCSPTTCVCVQVQHGCGGGASATVKLDVQTRQE